MKSRKIARTYPFQVFRHKIYLPFLHLKGFLNDSARNISTQKIFELSDLNIDPSSGTRYETISYKSLRNILKVPFEMSFNQFLDIWCGLGRSIIVAHEIGFKELHGLDISDQLIKMCKDNLIKSKIEAKLTCQDILDYDLPAGDLVIYIFNPFGKERIEFLLNKVKNRSYKTFIIYHNPKHSDSFDSKNLIQQKINKHFGLYDEKTFLYLYE
tara:strand:- start:7 stop:642 length:636 start_codon:yes stop_codon:yes gene_type:complete